MEISCQIRLLGAIEVEKEGEPLRAFRSRKALALLGYLVAQRQPLSRSHLAGLFWPDQTETRSRRNLSRELSHLSDLLPGCLEADYHTIQFSPSASCWVDTWTFTTLVQKVNTGTEEQRRKRDSKAAPQLTHLATVTETKSQVDQLAQAVALYRDDFMAGYYLDGCAEFEGWLIREQERWRQQIAETLDHLIIYYIVQRQDEQAQHYTRRWLMLEPWREAAHHHLMLLLARNGQRNAALAQYERCRRILDEELGVEPSAEIVALYEQIRVSQWPASLETVPKVFQVHTPVQPESEPTEADQPSHNLPAPVKSFVGRQAELIRLKDYLQTPEVRLITLIGPGGIGKTELALYAARSSLSDFSDGVWLAPLAGVKPPTAPPIGAPDEWRQRLHQIIITAVATAMGLTLSGTQSPEAQVKEHLRHKNLLLVVDNFEHLSEGTAVLQELLQAATGLKLLVTSRERLRLSAEWTVEVLGLPYPPAPVPQPDWGRAEITDPDDHWQTSAGISKLTAFEAILLLVSRISQVIPGFTLTPLNSLAIVKLCRLVEGMPLGLELLAGQMRGFTPDQTLEAVTNNLSRLQTNLRHIPERHRSIQAVFEWSWGLLTPIQQEFFACLTVFRGGFTAEAAEAVAGTDWADLLGLLDCSFIRRSESGRFDVHELLRQFGAEKLGQIVSTTSLAGTDLTGEIHNRHAHYYAHFLQQHQEHLYPNPDPATTQAIEHELNNIRVMWQWAINQAHPPLLSILAQAQTGLFYYYLTHGFFQEGLTVFGQAAERLREWTAESPEIPATAPEDTSPGQIISRLLVYHSRLAGQRGNYPLALASGQQALALAQQVQAPKLQVEAHLALADILMKQGNYSAARETLEQAFPLAQRLEQAFPAVRTSDLLAWTYWYQANLSQAGAYAELALAGYRELNHLPRVAGVLILLGKINCYKGDYLNSQNCLDEALKIYQQLNHHVGQIPVLGNLGMLYRLMGVYASAQPYLEQGLAMSQKLGQEELRMYGLEEMSRLYQARGDAQTAYEFARQALVLARRLGSPLGEWGGETCAGNALITLEDWDKAEQAHQAAWQRQQSLGHGGVGLENLAGLAQIALAQGKTSTALNKVEQILAWLNENDPAAVSLLLSIMWVCYRVLEANQDPRAINLLQTAYNELQRRAEAITETALRRSFLEDVVAHREILRAWSKVVPQIQQK